MCATQCHSSSSLSAMIMKPFFVQATTSVTSLVTFLLDRLFE